RLPPRKGRDRPPRARRRDRGAAVPGRRCRSRGRRAGVPAAHGRFITRHDAGSTNIHPHCYAAEAAWAVGTAIGDDTMLDAAARATRWVLDVSNPGSAVRVWRPAHDHTHHRRVDGLAQTLRLAVLTGAATAGERDA